MGDSTPPKGGPLTGSLFSSGRKTSSPGGSKKKNSESSPIPFLIKRKPETLRTPETPENPKLNREPDVPLSSGQQHGSASSTRRATFLNPLANIFATSKASSSVLGGFTGSPNKASLIGEEERQRVRELLFGTPMRRFSVNHSQNITRSGTLRVRIISCTSQKLRHGTLYSQPKRFSLSSSPLGLRKVSGDSGGSQTSLPTNGGSNITPITLALARHLHIGKPRKITYYVELELGGAKGRTVKKEKLKTNRKGEVRWDDSDAWIRLFVPGSEEGGDPILNAISEAARNGRLRTQKMPPVLKFKVICVTSSTDGIDEERQTELSMVLFETAVELDRLTSKAAPRIIELPLINTEDPEEEDLGTLTLETRFDRLNPRRLSKENLQFVEAAEDLAAEAASLLILAGQRPLMDAKIDGASTRGIKDEKIYAKEQSLSPVLMFPSATAYLTTVVAGLVPTRSRQSLSHAFSVPSSHAHSDKLHVVYEDDDGEFLRRATWPLPRREHPLSRDRVTHFSVDDDKKKRRFSCPQFNTADDLFEASVANIEQLESLREGWRMWRMAHRSQMQPSHRAQDFANIGERFVNRGVPSASLINSSSFSSSSHSLSQPLSPRSLAPTSISSSGSKARTLFELGGDSYDLSTYLEDHPRQKEFFRSVSARIGKLALLERLSYLENAGANSNAEITQSFQGIMKAKRKNNPSPVKAPTFAKPWCHQKIAVLTGGTSGVGECIGRELCARGVKRLILLVQNIAKGRTKALEWTEKYRNVEVDIVHCDLASMQSTNLAADQVRHLFAPGETLDLLILCAACVNNPNSDTVKKEFEETFAVNYMSNFLLVHALIDLMDKQGTEDESRIILAGCTAVPPFGDSIDLNDLQGEKHGLGQLGIGQYIHTKTMLSCFASELGRRLEIKGNRVTANVFYPGAVKSRLADNVLVAFNPVVAKLADAAYGLTEGVFIRSPEQGATLALHLCSDPGLTGVNCKVFHSGVTGHVTDFKPHVHFGIANNTELCRKLWAISGKMLNQALGKDSQVARWWDYFRPARKGDHS